MEINTKYNFTQIFVYKCSQKHIHYNPELERIYIN